MPKNAPLSRVIQILIWLIENEELIDIQPSKLQSRLDIDRTTIRNSLDQLVSAGVATVDANGITNIYTLKIKLPKGTERKEKKTKLQVVKEKTDFQERVRFSNSPNEPMWELESGVKAFEEACKEYPHLLSWERLYRNEGTKDDCLIGQCRECKGVFHAGEFNKDRWLCEEKCMKKWLGEDVFRCDSEDEE